ncbi:tyrosine 2,3-aminomutase [Nocardia sp. NPDC058499]|uniref:tyrosine 2,3-aminomutase n=1 Tax=Nocardia sp. NPDC058499 TaxID=3346530 RepID=UPI00365860F6
MAVRIDGQTLRLTDVRRIAEEKAQCAIAPEAIDRVAGNRAVLERLVHAGQPIYGVTTGYGEMVYVLVDTAKETELQTNLVRSHSAGVGPLFDEAESRAILCSRLNALVRGHSAVRPKLVERLALYLNENIVPAIPEIGSLGASGDLVPLAHLASTVIGEGYVLRDGRPIPADEILKERRIIPLPLRFKEGLALINGTSAMTGVGALVLCHAFDQVRQAEMVTALVLEVLRASAGPFAAKGHEVAKPHRGQIETAANILALTEGSGLLQRHSGLLSAIRHQQGTGDSVRTTDTYLQKAYSLRAVPQVLGAVRDALVHAVHVVETELNSANDNPLVFEDDEVFHGANFHGQSVAFVMDYVTIALTQLGVLSERRLNRLLNRHLNDSLPAFLVAGQPGLSSGFAGAQYPATALVAENRTIGPASIQSIPSNGDNQDVVSMGLIAARNARRVLRNNTRILAIEWLAAAQAVDVSGRYRKLSPAGKQTYDLLRSLVPALDSDRFMGDDLELVAAALDHGKLLDTAHQSGIPMY